MVSSAYSTSRTDTNDSVHSGVVELKAAGCTAAELKAAGYTADELQAAGHTAAEIKVAAYTIDELKAAGCTTAEMKAAGCTSAEMKQRSRLEVRAGTCAARRMRYQKANTLTCSSRFRAVQMKPDSGFQWFWERCNLMGSAKFKKLIDAYS